MAPNTTRLFATRPPNSLSQLRNRLVTLLRNAHDKEEFLTLVAVLALYSAAIFATNSKDKDRLIKAVVSLIE